jgi:hypothetical protein
MSSGEARTGLDGLRRDLSDVCQAVVAARRTVESGGLVDLSGLEDRIADLCGSVQRLPKTSGRALQPELLGLVDELSQLTEELGRQRDQVKSELEETNIRQAAASAYRKSQK